MKCLSINPLILFRTERAREKMKNNQPLGRVGELDDICRVFAFVISDDNAFMTGSNVLSDGGLSLTI